MNALILIICFSCSCSTTSQHQQLPLCIDLGCTGPQLCSSRETCMCNGQACAVGPGSADAGVDAPTDAGLDAPTADAPASTCIASAGRCCLFNASACPVGMSCYYIWNNSVSPAQSDGYCRPTGTLVEGQGCALAQPNSCKDGLTCDVYGEQNGVGVCRTACDPAHPICGTGLTCTKVMYCVNSNAYPFCPPSQMGSVGVCR